MTTPVIRKSIAMLKSAIRYLAIFVVIYTIMGYVRQPSMPSAPMMTDTQGQVVTFDTNTPVLVYFWGSWCHICRQTSPKVNALSHTHPVVTVAVSSGDDQAVLAYLTDKGYDFRVVNDQAGSIFGQWQGQVTPSYMIVKDQKAVQGFVGIQPEWLLRLRLWLAQWQ